MPIVGKFRGWRRTSGRTRQPEDRAVGVVVSSSRHEAPELPSADVSLSLRDAGAEEMASLELAPPAAIEVGLMLLNSGLFAANVALLPTVPADGQPDLASAMLRSAAACALLMAQAKHARQNDRIYAREDISRTIRGMFSLCDEHARDLADAATKYVYHGKVTPRAKRASATEQGT
jgi:hypothetical protein